MTNSSKRNGSTRAYRNTRKAILNASTICYVCGEPGADATDHRTAHSRGGSDDPSNLFPIHHNNRNSKGVSCNREKGAKDPEVQLTTSRQW